MLPRINLITSSFTMIFDMIVNKKKSKKKSLLRQGNFIFKLVDGKINYCVNNIIYIISWNCFVSTSCLCIINSWKIDTED